MPAPFVEIPASRAAGFVWPDPAVRMPHWPKIGGDAPERLRAMRVLLVGVGAIGRSVAEMLASLGVGTLLLVDRDRYAPANLLTTAIGPAEVGLQKASAAARACKAIAPDATVMAFDGELALVPMATMRGTVVVLATDNLSVEVEVGRRCNALGLPLAQAAVVGAWDLVQVRLWRNADGERSPCPACRFSADEWRMAEHEVITSCAGAARTGLGPTQSTRALSATAAGLLVLLLQDWRLGADHALDDCEVSWQGTTCRRTKLRRNERCRSEHRRWARVAVPALSFRSARELLQMAAQGCDQAAGDGVAATGAPATGVPAADAAAAAHDGESALVVEGFAWVEQGACVCPSLHVVRRFVRGPAAAGACGRCGSAIEPVAFASCTAVHVARLGPLADVPLSQLGAHDAESAWVAGADAPVLLAAPEAPAAVPTENAVPTQSIMPSGNEVTP